MDEVKLDSRQNVGLKKLSPTGNTRKDARRIPDSVKWCPDNPILANGWFVRHDWAVIISMTAGILSPTGRSLYLK